MTLLGATPPSPAERYAAARRRSATPRFTEFAAGYEFPLDPFQVEACRALEEGHSVLVAAPTGAGKTVVGEFAVHLALSQGNKCFYTTPIKALSNQKYIDFVRRHGPEQVGLLTGDNTINGEAPIVVMTTEVLRNMLYAGSPTLGGLGYVVMDEVHYLGDRFRGGVWEEVIINLPASVHLVALSATVSNAEEFGEWLVSVRGETRVVVDEHRPVPLWQHMMIGPRLYDLFIEKDGETQLNPELARAAAQATRHRQLTETRRGRRPPRRRRDTPSRPTIVETLDARGLLPAIVFVFSRAGCDNAVTECLRAGLKLNRPAEAARAVEIAESRVAGISDADLFTLGYGEWIEGLRRGIAAHHAGLLPVFKETVEELFAAGLIKVVFATETLALGINMPARTVVLERLVKWNGEEHVTVTPGEYTQLTGRAGRRGIDVEGHAVVCWAQDVDPASVAGLASRRTYPLRSSFRPSYNMAVNLVGQMGRQRARTLLESSFAQFQADRAVVGLARQIRRNEGILAEYEKAMQCHLGDFAEYAALRRELSDTEAAAARRSAGLRRAAAAESLSRLRAGDIVELPVGRRGALAVVLDPGEKRGEAKPVVLTEERKIRRLSVVDVRGPLEPIGRLRIPRDFNPRSAADRRDLASGLRSREREGALTGRRPASPEATGYEEQIAELRAALRRHPCHGCAERETHARWAARSWQLARETETLRARVANRTGSLARTFDQVCAVLDELGYLHAEEVSGDGRRLARLYTELDLLAAECLRRGTWEGLTAAELAGVAAALVYEPREDEPDVVRVSPPRLAAACERTLEVWAELTEVERRHRVEFLREPSLRFVPYAYRWARGASLATVLGDEAMSPGDFVRWTRQLIDLLGQIEQAADGDLRAAAAEAVGALRRGVVDYAPAA
ncbi:MAG: DEAD/DEAH box helicase [Acidothermus sp.]|nr:DEAD/DEAH box helicase [Acidothermus sp.]MCL6538021.1 DEAD/DEAH box helicase [Acidothermus sp.]